MNKTMAHFFGRTLDSTSLPSLPTKTSRNMQLFKALAISAMALLSPGGHVGPGLAAAAVSAAVAEDWKGDASVSLQSISVCVERV